MKLTGLILDKNRGSYPNGSWKFGKNFIISKDGEAILNEGGFDEYSNPPMTVIGTTVIGNCTIICCGNDFDSEIGTLIDGVYKTIINERLLNFKLQQPILGVATYNHKNEIVFCFTDDYNNPRVLNLTNLPFPSGLTSNYKLVNPNEFTLANLFPNVKNARVIDLAVTDTGGNLKSGVYSVSIAHIFDDDSATIWQELSNPIVVTDDVAASGGMAYDKYDGCEAGSNTSKSIRLTFGNLDTNFTKFKVGIVAKIGGIISSYETSTYYYNSDTKTIVISSLDILSTIDIKELLVQSSIYIKARAIALSNNRLHLANLKGLPVIDYQQYANDINVEWFRGDYVSLNEIDTSYKNSKILYFKKGWKSGEVAALNVGLRLKQGGYYGVWHIPGRIALAGDTDYITTPSAPVHPYNHIAPYIKKYQIEDTSTDESGTGLYGKMGYWENINEQYPDNFTDFAGQNVRHHKFPELAELEDYAQGFITEYVPTVIASSTVALLNPQTWNDVSTGYWRLRMLSTSGTPYGSFNTYNTILNASSPQQINVTGSLHFVPIVGTSPIINVKLYLRHNGIATIKFTRNFELSYAQNIDIIVDDILLDTGDSLELDVSSSEGQFNVTTSTLTYYCDKLDYVISTGKVTKPLGIRISNVVIPIALQEYVDGWEIFYCERTVENMTRVGQDIIYGSNWWDTTPKWVTDGNIKLHAFDMMANRLAVMPTYLNRQLKFTVPSAEEDVSVIANAESNYRNFTYVTNTADSYRILPCKGVTYLPAFIDALVYDNTDGEDGYLVTIDSHILSGIGATAERRFLADICVLRNDVYLNYSAQILVSTGYFAALNPIAELQPSLVVYGGDTVISPYAYKMNHLSTTANLVPNIVCESISNIGLRHEGKLAEEIYFPKSSITDILSGDALAYGNYYGYNGDYNAINNYVQPIIDYPNVNRTNTFPYRIVRSLPKQTENVAINWRIFLISDYYEMVSDKGYVNKLTSDTNKKLYIAHRYALFVASVKDTIDTLSGALSLKEGDLFDREPLEIVPTEAGYIGNQSRFAVFICKYGYFHIDKEKAKIYLISDTIKELTGDTVSEFFVDAFRTIDVTDDGLLLYDNFSSLDYDDDGNPIVYRNATSHVNYDIDNPFVQTGLTAGYDDETERIIISCNHRKYYPIAEATDPGEEEDSMFSEPTFIPTGIGDNKLSVENNSFTISYSPKFNYWVCLHDYIVNHFVIARTGLLTIINPGAINYINFTSFIYTINSKLKLGKYPNTLYPTYADFIFDNSTTPDILIENIAYSAFITSDSVTFWDKTLTHVMLYTIQECSGEIELVIKTWANQLTGGNVRNVKGIWILNDFKDRMITTNVEIIDKEGDVILDNLENEEAFTIVVGQRYVVSGVTSDADYIEYNGVNYTYNGQQITPVNGITDFVRNGTAIVKNFKFWYEKSNFITNFAVVRLKYDNIEQLRMKLTNVLINFK